MDALNTVAKRFLATVSLAVQTSLLILPVGAATLQGGTTAVNINQRAASAVQAAPPKIIVQKIYIYRNAPPPVSRRHSARTAHYYAKRNLSWGQRHPKIKSAAIGAGVGAVGGAVLGAITHRGIGRGLLIGAGTGAGAGLIRSSTTLKRHPIIQDGATGAAIGLGVGGAAGRGTRAALIGTGLGALGGLGFGALRHHAF